jgi:iron complex outermembrane recepter protein
MNVVRTCPTRAAVGRRCVWILLAVPMVVPGQESPPKGQASDEHMQEVIITGSRIARPDLDRLQPTTVVGAQAFDERGFTDVGQALSEVPGFGVQPSSSVNTQSAFGIAQSFVDLYSLGSQRTLVLINGRRFVSSNTASLGGPTNPGQQVDLNVVPTKLIDRVETVSVGGAPIYGSDAIAGTVNIIMKKNYQGVDLDAQAGVSDHKDAWNYRARALAGMNFADDRGNIVVVGEVNKSDGLVGTARKNFSSDLAFVSPATPGPFRTVLTANETVTGISTSGIPYVDDNYYAPGTSPVGVGVTSASGQALAFSPGSSALKPYDLGGATSNPVFGIGGDGVRLSQFSNLLSPTERINVDTLGNFKITDHVNAFAEGWFSETHATNLIAQPAYNTTLFGGAGTLNGDFKINVNNPFLSQADRQTIQSALNAYQASNFGGAGAPLDPAWSPDTFYLGRANTDLESGRATASQVLGRGVVGVGGDFSLGERNYTWEAAMNYGWSRNDSAVPAYIFQNLQNALDATTDPSGNIICAGNPVAAAVASESSTCAPLNVFGLGSPSAAAKAYITHIAMAESLDEQRDGTLNLSGDIIKLPAGEWKFAAGYENRRESAKFTADSFYTEGFGQLSASNVEGSYRTNEVYAETLIPIFEPNQDLPALHQMEFEGAVRHVDNSIAGTSNTWTAGLRWSPIQDVQFRGNRTTSIRAPAVTELFLPASTNFEFANDPCDKNFVGQGTSPATRAKNCAAAGINTATFVSNVVNATAQGLTSGNANLQSETAISKTYGVVIRPHWIPRLNLSVDYIDIKMNNAIQQLNLQEIMDACYDSPDYPNASACTQFTRNAQNQVSSFHDGFVNAGLLHFQGITVGADYTVDLPGAIGRLQTRVSYLDTRQLTLQVGSAAPVNEAGELGTATVGNNVAAPKSKGTLDLTYLKGPFSWYWQAQYISSMNFSNVNTATSQDILRVNPWWLINSTLGYEINKMFSVHFIVNNVFDKQPPFPALAAGTGGNFASATTLYFPGIIGRTYLLNVAARF